MMTTNPLFPYPLYTVNSLVNFVIIICNLQVFFLQIVTFFANSYLIMLQIITSQFSLCLYTRECNIGKRCREICDRGQSLDRLKFR